MVENHIYTAVLRRDRVESGVTFQSSNPAPELGFISEYATGLKLPCALAASAYDRVYFGNGSNLVEFPTT